MSALHVFLLSQLLFYQNIVPTWYCLLIEELFTLGVSHLIFFQTKAKKPTRPPTGPTAGVTKQPQRDSTDDSLCSSKSSSREQLNGSQSSNLDRLGSFSSTKSPLAKTGSRKASREDKPGFIQALLWVLMLDLLLSIRHLQYQTLEFRNSPEKVQGWFRVYLSLL